MPYRHHEPQRHRIPRARYLRGRLGLLNLGFHLRIVDPLGQYKALEGVLVDLTCRNDRPWIARRIDILTAYPKARA
jgi:hypothetical protein